MEVKEIREKISESLFVIWSAAGEIEKVNGTIDFVKTCLASISELRSEYKEDLKSTENIDKLFCKILPIIMDGLVDIGDVVLTQSEIVRESIKGVKTLLKG